MIKFGIVDGPSVFIDDEEKTDLVQVKLGDEWISISRQQLTELGALLITLGGIQSDFDSLGELLDGYGLLEQGREVFEKLVENEL